tara:strand:- start:9461 stop:15715 length:6255 start_codon:yes stop_codon:yes gene_type:complete
MAKKFFFSTLELEDGVRLMQFLDENPDYDYNQRLPLLKKFDLDVTFDLASSNTLDVPGNPGNGYSIEVGKTFPPLDPDGILVTQKDADAYYALRPQLNPEISEETFQKYVSLLENDITTSTSPPPPVITTWEGHPPQTKDNLYIADDPKSEHFHLLIPSKIDELGTGVSGPPQVTENIGAPVDYAHAHKIKDFKITDEIVWGHLSDSENQIPHTHTMREETTSGTSFEKQESNLPVDHEGVKQKTPTAAPTEYKIHIKEYPKTEKNRYLIKVQDLQTTSIKILVMLPYGAGQSTGAELFKDLSFAEKKDPVLIKALTRAYVKDLLEQYPGATLEDKAGLFPATSGQPMAGQLVTLPKEETDVVEESGKEPVRELTFPDDRYSEKLQVGISHINSKSPFDLKTTMGFILYSDHMIRDHEAGESDWIKLINKYAFPTPVIRPGEKKPAKDRKEVVNTNSAKSEKEVTKENEEISNPAKKLEVYNKRKNVSIFAGNTMFGGLEAGLMKMKASDDPVLQVYGEVLHKINLRSFMARAMACIAEKMAIGDIAESLCKAVIRTIGLDLISKVLMIMPDAFIKKPLGPVFGAIENQTKNIDIIDGKDPLSQAGKGIQQRNLNKEKRANKMNRNEIDDFVKMLKNFVDLEALCERLGDFIGDVPGLLFAPGGLAKMRMEASELLPEIPKPPRFELPYAVTGDIMGVIIEEMERAIKQLIVNSIVDMVKGVMEQVMLQCEDIDSPDLSRVNSDKMLNLPQSPNIPGGAYPLETNINLDNADQFLDGLIPSSRAPEVVKLLDEISSRLKPTEICQLLSGSAREHILRFILKIIENKFSILTVYITNTADVHRLFKLLGKYVDQTFCTAIVSNVTAISDMCEEIVDNSIHEDALERKGFTAHEIASILDAERRRNKDAFEKMAELLLDPDSITEDIPPMLCTETSKGLVPSNPPAMQHNIEVMLNAIYDSLDMTFTSDAGIIKELFIGSGLVEDKNSAPDPPREGIHWPSGEDRPEDFTPRRPQRASRAVMPDLKNLLDNGVRGYMKGTLTKYNLEEDKYENTKKYWHKTEISLQAPVIPSGIDLDLLLEQNEDLPEEVKTLLQQIEPTSDVVKFSMSSIEESFAMKGGLIEKIVPFYEIATFNKKKPDFSKLAEEIPSLTDHSEKKYISKNPVENQEIKNLIIELIFGEDSFKDPDTSLNPLLFSRLITRSIKKDLLSDLPEDSYSTGQISNLENTLREIYERILLTILEKNVFKPVSKSSLFDLETFESLDITDTQDIDDMGVNKCNPDGSAGNKPPTGLFGIEDLKGQTIKLFEQKSCGHRGPDDIDPLTEAMLETCAISYIRLVLIERIMKSVFAFTRLDPVAVMSSEEFINSFLIDLDKRLSFEGFPFKEEFKKVIYDYCKNKLDLGMRLKDPFLGTGEELIEEDLDINTALKYVCKEVIFNIKDAVGNTLKDINLDTAHTWGLTPMMKTYIPITKIVNAPGAMNSLDNLENNLNYGFSPASINKGGGLSSRGKQLSSFPWGGGTKLTIEMAHAVETYNQRHNPNIMTSDVVWKPGLHTNHIFDLDDKENTSPFNEKLKDNGGFLLQKYIRIEYKDGIKPERLLTWFDISDDPNNDYKHSICGIDAFEHALHMKYLSQTDEELNELSPTNISDLFDIHFGIRMMLVLPDFNLYRNEDKHVASKVFTDIMDKIPDDLKEKVQIKEFENAAYRLRTNPSRLSQEDPLVVNLGLNKDFIDGDVTVTHKETDFVFDVNMFPIVSVEEKIDLYDELAPVNSGPKGTYGALVGTTHDPGLYGNIALAMDVDGVPISHRRRLFSFKEGKKAVGQANKNIEKTVDTSSVGLNYTYTNELYADVINRFWKDSSGEPILKYKLFDQLFENSFKDNLLDKLRDTPEYKLMEGTIFPVDSLSGLVTEYIASFPRPSAVTDESLFHQTRITIKSLFDSLKSGDDYKYSDPNSNSKSNHANASKNASTNLNPIPNLAAIAAKTVPMMIKGMAETIDPAVKTATLIQQLSGQSPHMVPFIIQALLPPPLFPPFGPNVIPITPLGIGYLGLSFLEPFAAAIKQKQKKKKEKEDCPEDETEEEEIQK